MPLAFHDRMHILESNPRTWTARETNGTEARCRSSVRADSCGSTRVEIAYIIYEIRIKNVGILKKIRRGSPGRYTYSIEWSTPGPDGRGHYVL